MRSVTSRFRGFYYGVILSCGVTACSSSPVNSAPEPDDATADLGSEIDATSWRDGAATSEGSATDAGPDLATGEGGDAQPGAGCIVPVSEDDQPTLLSQTGCVDRSDPTKPVATFVPYDVSSPLWSDGATKQRFLYLPPGQKIHVKDCATDVASCSGNFNAGATAEDEGHWDLPIGAVLMKTFSFGGKLVETRLLMHVDDRTWYGFSYEWNGLGPSEKQTEATLLAAEKDKPLTTLASTASPDGGAQTWHFPSREQCLQCHTAEAGRSLGPSTQQLNFANPAGQKNQVDAFIARGVFDVPPKKIDPFPAPAVAASGDLDARARSYMQVNCAICHRPGGALSDVDLRFTTPLKDTLLCNQMISRGTGETPALRLVPGSPATSALSFRMHDLGGTRMPKIGSLVEDKDGEKLIDDWITSIPACP